MKIISCHLFPRIKTGTNLLFDTLIWAETEGAGGSGPPEENHKLPFVS